MSHKSTPENDEYDSDEPPRLELDLAELKKQATQALGVECVTVQKLTKGARHEIFVLRFSNTQQPIHDSLFRAGFACIARFARRSDTLQVDRSEAATIRHVRQYTSVPVPEIYHEEYKSNNAVGAAYILMEKLPGVHLYDLWEGLSLDQQKTAISQIASVVVELASLKFDQIGCLTEDGIGPVINPNYNSPQGPFQTTEDFLRSFVSPQRAGSHQISGLLGQVQKELDGFLEGRAGAPYLRSPFGLVHADFDGQNLLFAKSKDGCPPHIKLTGVIDFEYAYCGPLYLIYDYPIFIQDTSMEPENYATNAVLRPHFVQEVFRQLPGREAQQIFIEAMNSKTFALSFFEAYFVSMVCSGQILVDLAKEYVECIRSGTGHVNRDRQDYLPEHYSEAGEIIDQHHAGERIERPS